MLPETPVMDIQQLYCMDLFIGKPRFFEITLNYLTKKNLLSDKVVQRSLAICFHPAMMVLFLPLCLGVMVAERSGSYKFACRRSGKRF